MSEQPTEGGADATSKKNSRPTRQLPTDRIKFDRQLDLIRAYVAASGPSGKPVTNKDVAEISKMAASTASLGNAFFLDVGILRRADGGYLPSEEAISFARAHQWNAETAAHKLAPLLLDAWFGPLLTARLDFGTLQEAEALTVLADEAGAGPEYRPQLRMIVDYVCAAGIVSRDNGTLMAVDTQQKPKADVESETEVQPSPAAPVRSSISTSFVKPTEGVVQFHVSVRVDMNEFEGWKPERITAFFGGIAAVLAAKGSIEEDSTPE